MPLHAMAMPDLLPTRSSARMARPPSPAKPWRPSPKTTLPRPVWQAPQYFVAGAVYDIEVAVRTYCEPARLSRGHDRTGNWGTLP